MATRYYLKCGVTYYGRRYNAASGGTDYTGGSNGTYTDNAMVFNTWNMMDGDWFDIEVYHASMEDQMNNPGLDFAGRLWGYGTRIDTDGKSYIPTSTLVWRVTCRQPDGDIHQKPYLEISIPNLTNFTSSARVDDPYATAADDYRLPPFSIRTVLVDSVQNRLNYLGMTREEFTPVWDKPPRFQSQYTCCGNDVPTQNIQANNMGTSNQINPGLYRTPIGSQLDGPDSYHAYHRSNNTDSLFTYTQGTGGIKYLTISPEEFENHFHSRQNRGKLAAIEKVIKNSSKELLNGNYPFCTNWASYPTRGTGKTTGNPVFAGPVIGGNYAWSSTRDYEQMISIIAGPDYGPNMNNNCGYSCTSGTQIGSSQFTVPLYMSAWRTPMILYRAANGYHSNIGLISRACAPFEFSQISGAGSTKYCSLSLFRITKSNLTTAKSNTYMGDAPNYTNMPYMGAYKYSDRDAIVQSTTRHQLIDHRLGNNAPFTWYGVIPTWYTVYLGSDAYPLLSHNCGVIGTGSGNIAKTAAYTSTNSNYIADTLVGRVYDGMSWGNDPEGISDNSITSRNGSVGIYVTTCAYTGADTAQIPAENYAHESFWGNDDMVNCIIHPSLFSDWPALDVYGLTDTTNNKPLFRWKCKTTMHPYDKATYGNTIANFNSFNETINVKIFGSH